MAMSKHPNLKLRGSVYYFRIAVPKSLRAIRAEQGERSKREIWKSLGTGDLRAARAALAQAKAEALRTFEAEIRSFRERPAPTIDQLREVASAFRDLVRASLANERLLTLPDAKAVAAAEADMAALSRLMDATTDSTEWQGLSERYFDLAWIPLAGEDMQQARAALTDRLWVALETLDYRLVRPFITQAARNWGYRIDPESDAYRQLAHLLLKQWIVCLTEAPEAFRMLGEPLRDQDVVLAAWRKPAIAQSGGIEAKEGRPLPASALAITPDRDIRELFQTYLRERFPRIARNAMQDKQRTIQQFMEVAGVKDVALYRKTDVTAYKALLVQLPVNAGRDFAGKTMRQVIDSAPVDAKKLAPKTIRSRLSILGSFGGWMSENVDGVDASNFRTTSPVAKKPETPVREFSDAEVRAIFHSPAFTGCASERDQRSRGSYKIRDYRYWLPLLAAFTGCRLNELAQLRVDDVFEIEGIPLLRITDAGDGQSLKTKSSERLVPVHSTVISAGFLQLVEAARAAKQEVVFAEIPVGRTGRRAEAAGKWFRKFLARMGLKGSGLRGGMHRFRHSVVQKLRDQGHSDSEIALIVGHETRATPMTAGYGSSRAALVRQQRAILESLRYVGLEVERVAT